MRLPQRFVFHSRRRHRVIVAGRRFGKTYLCLMILITAAAQFDRSKNWYVCPTKLMAKDIAWEELKFMLGLDEYGQGNPIVRDVSETDLVVRFINGSTIALKGASEPDKLRGRGLKTVVLDEYADMDPGVWTVIRPQLSDKRMRLQYGELGRAVFIGTPRGYNHFKRLYDDVRVGKSGSDWRAWRFTSLDGGNIDATEIEKAKYDLNERDFRQEYLATFESIQGRVYHSFVREFFANALGFNLGNLDPSLRDPGPGIPISVGMDFNVNPMTAILGSKMLMDRAYLTGLKGAPEGGKQYEFHVWKEYVLHNSGTTEMMQAIRADFPDRHLIVFPDPTGGARSTKTANLGETDHTIIQSFGADIFVPQFKTNSDKYNHVNGLLCNTLGIRRLLIHPQACPFTVDSLDGLQYKDGTNLADKDSGFDHCTDALSYAVIGLFPIATGYSQISTVSM